MGVPKGVDNFRLHRDAKQSAALDHLLSELEKARRKKTIYPDEAALIADMSMRTGKHRTTLTRNPKYYEPIVKFLAAQAGCSTYVAVKDASPALLRAKLIDTQVEVGQLRAMIAKNNREVSTINEHTAVAPPPKGPAAHTAFVDTVWALRAVLDRLNADGEVFEVDIGRCEIRDLAAAPGRQVVVRGPRLQPFMSALKTLLDQER